MANLGIGTDSLRSYLLETRIATLAELKKVAGGAATMTVFRKLKRLGYQTSYSHRGKYYTLAEIPHWDEQGLWDHRAAWFSRYGNLLATSQHFVEVAEAGLTAVELQGLLHVESKGALLELYRRKAIDRREFQGVYVYLSREDGTGRRQRLKRQEPPEVMELGESAVAEALSPEVKAAIILFYSLLDEQQRRLYAGLEAHKLGYGGDRKVADFLGLDAHTVARGRQELLSSQVVRDGVRQPGGGRKSTEKKRLT
jgi:hypothetical protein